MTSTLACYVGGKGMFASEQTWSFKTSLFACLRQTQLGFDTRHQYYRHLFPELADAEFDRMVCDPIEYYDPDWPLWQQSHSHLPDAICVTRFWLERDLKFQAQAQVGLFGLNEAGFGTAINISRFLQADKPVFGFYNPEYIEADSSRNFHNVLQLQLTHPRHFHLSSYHSAEDLAQQVTDRLMQQRRK